MGRKGSKCSPENQPQFVQCCWDSFVSYDFCPFGKTSSRIWLAFIAIIFMVFVSSSCHRPPQIQNFLNDRGIFVTHNEPLSTTDNTSVYANEMTLGGDPRQLYSGSWPSERPNMVLEGWNFQVNALESEEVRRVWRLSSIKVLEQRDS